uniref:Disease resistance protein RPS2 n=1 Tax=Anthurium amnicola TaxID=1678845 RepID=A0A1D1Y176_9ARAE
MGGWFECLHARYKLGGQAADLLDQVRQMKEKRDSLGDLVNRARPEAAKEVARRTASIIGCEEMLSEIRSYLQDDKSRIIGILGIGGVGKTTLLTEINNEFLVAADTSNKFDVVIWVSVTREPDVPRIQDDIGVRLGYCRRGDDSGVQLPKNDHVRLETLNQELSKRKFLMLLDDMWHKLDLSKIGVPLPSGDNKSKIVLTTRFSEVCDDMEADVKKRVPYLGAEASWELFSKRVGTSVNLSDPFIHQHAKAMAVKCKGLPLALATVGRAMANATTVSEWTDAEKDLTEFPSDISGMQQEVFSSLKFSFDRLNDKSLQQCLLYCSLFSPNREIDRNQLIEYWVGEGLLDGGRHSTDISRARRKGSQILGKLKNSCLLEAGSWGDRYVKLHNMVREMALWLTTGEFDRTNMFSVNAEKGLTRVSRVEEWATARRISLMRNQIEEFPRLANNCDNLQTLLITGNKTSPVVIPENFFRFMCALRVLDLSYNKIEELPGEIGLLVELQYLNLSYTEIKSLPKELGRLVKLRQLNLGKIFHLRKVPCEALVTLQCLQTLNMCGSGYYLTWERGDSDEEKIFTTNDLDSLTRMEELGVDIETYPSLEKLVSSARMLKSTKFLRVIKLSGISSSQLSAALGKLNGLEDLTIGKSPELEELRFSSGQLPHLEILAIFDLSRANIVLDRPQEIGIAGYHLSLFPRLRRLVITFSHGFRDLTWIQQLPCLEYIQLKGCEGMEELLADGEGANGENVECNLPNLKAMLLFSLPKLRIISQRALVLPLLAVLKVSKCPELKRLSLVPQSLSNIKEIHGEQEWWNRLEFYQQNDTVKNTIRSSLLPYFIPI